MVILEALTPKRSQSFWNLCTVESHSWVSTTRCYKVPKRLSEEADVLEFASEVCDLLEESTGSSGMYWCYLMPQHRNRNGLGEIFLQQLHILFKGVLSCVVWIENIMQNHTKPIKFMPQAKDCDWNISRTFQQIQQLSSGKRPLWCDQPWHHLQTAKPRRLPGASAGDRPQPTKQTQKNAFNCFKIEKNIKNMLEKNDTRQESN